VTRDQDSARFLESAVPSPLVSKLAADAAIYDLSALRAALPGPAPRVLQQPTASASWTSDFMQQSPTPVTSTEQTPLVNSIVALEADATTRPATVMPSTCDKGSLRF
jgi:hypothetical protein